MHKFVPRLSQRYLYPLLMTNYALPTLSLRSRWFVPFISLLTVVTNSCTPAATARGAVSPATQQSATAQVPGVPNRPDLVTVVPFYWKPNESETEKTKVVIPAEVDGHHGNFIVDLGSPSLMLNRTFLRPSPTGGLDTVRESDTMDTHRLKNWNGADHAHVTMRIGTLLVDFQDTAIKTPNPEHFNAVLNHEWGNFGWNFSPRLGNIGPSVLAQFETIIDYTHQRLVLIRLDQAGNRLVQVPAYTPAWSAP